MNIKSQKWHNIELYGNKLATENQQAKIIIYVTEIEYGIKEITLNKYV